ncbi:site-specific DNA-methyltransferase [Thiocapsa sp.]|uniref:site-specific DNA-methyltransferase n=1 Tax=Thiocapsa sp. TaxID=2024551 RepID=UPI00359388B3
MPELFFKGKEFVFNHHHAVPFRPLVPDPKRSVGESGKAGRLDGNLIIHGDNLHALKALLPLYAGKVDCIFIDPPYNTGNESWCYNDNVNSPMMREWLDSNPVGIEDGLRHDKWLAMMWPRLRLLHELLSKNGSLWMTLDDNEIHRARAACDEIFGAENFVSLVTWQRKVSPANDAKWFSNDNDFLLVYAREKTLWRPVRIARSEGQMSYYTNPDHDPRGPWNSSTYTCNKTKAERPNLYYPIIHPKTGEEVWPQETAVWKYNREKCEAHKKAGLLYWGKDDDGRTPRIKKFLDVAGDIVPRTIWTYDSVGSTQEATTELQGIFPEQPFNSPKPSRLIRRVIDIATENESLVLDSFAGSATTAHAVLAANAKDGGNRRFILVECEDYADTLTAERVRRVIQGYDFQGIQREELHRERLTFTSLKKANKLLDHVESIKHLEGHRFDRIKAEVKDGELIVTGECEVTQKTEGLGGEFTYCTLGTAVEMDKLLTGENLPAFDQLGALLFHMATNQARPIAAEPLEVAGVGYLGASSAQHVWLIYRPDLDFLKSRDAALTLSRAKAIPEAKPDKPHLVYAPTRFVSKRVLEDAKLPVEVAFAPLPFALYRVEKPQ